MENNYSNTAQYSRRNLSDSLNEVSLATGISSDSIAYALKVMGLYLLKATKASGEFIFDATKFSAKMLSLTYNINEIDIKKHVMQRDVGLEVIEFIRKNPHILVEFDDHIKSMISEYNYMEKNSSEYTQERQKQISYVIDEIDVKMEKLDSFLKESEARLKDSKRKLNIHLLEDQGYDQRQFETEKFDNKIPDNKMTRDYQPDQYSPNQSPNQYAYVETEEPVIPKDYQPEPSKISSPVDSYSPKSKPKGRKKKDEPKLKAYEKEQDNFAIMDERDDIATHESKEVEDKLDSYLKDDDEAIKVFSTPPYQEPENSTATDPATEFIHDAESIGANINNAETVGAYEYSEEHKQPQTDNSYKEKDADYQGESLASINERLIKLEELKSKNDSLKDNIKDKIFLYKEENSHLELSDDDSLKAMLESDDELRSLIAEQADTEKKLKKLLKR